MKEHLEITNVKVIGESETPEAFCVCRSIETDQIDKANGMMKDYPLLTSFISDKNLQANGRPIVKIREWSHTKGKLKFDFCFPIIRIDSLPKSDSLTYKELQKEKALKAIYHGNYITSDRAWYELTRYAKANGYQISGLPFEYFHNNPNLGLRESQWLAEIYLPVK